MSGRPTLRTLGTAPAGRVTPVSRPRLAGRLAALARRRLTLLVAPTGYGKTTLLDEWEPSERRRVTRIELEPRDGEPRRLWERLGAVDGGFAELVNALADGPGLVLVLDDVHLLGGRCDDALGYLAERLPEHVSLVLASRTEPRLELGSLPSRGEVGRLGAADLRLDREELAAVAGPGVSAAELDELERRTQGWPAAVRLAAAELHETGRLGGFSGRSPAVAEYLQEELLADVDPRLRRFLAEACLLERPTAALCDALLGRDDAAERLDDAERAGLLVEGSLHPLVADLLAAELPPARRTALHLRAAGLLEAEGDVAAAVGHSAAGGSAAGARSLLLRHWRQLAAHERVSDARRALEALGDAAPPLAVAWAAANGAPVPPARGPLPFGSGDAELERAVVEAWFGCGDSAAAARARRLADEAGDPLLAAAAGAALASALYTEGRDEEAIEAASPFGPATAASAPAPTVRALTVRSLACERAGRPAAAAAARRVAAAIVARHGLAGTRAASELGRAAPQPEPRAQRIARTRPRRSDLSSAELAVLRLLPTPLTQREIGRELYLSLNTVKTHAASIYRKLEVSSRSEAVVAARRLNLLPG